MNANFFRKLRFFKPTSDLKILLLLSEIQDNHKITQNKLAKYIQSAPSMINAYIKQLEADRFLKKNKKSKRNVEYTITKRGIERKNYLLVTYMNELIELYNLTKSNIELFIERIAQQNIRNCIFYGAGETARVIITVLDDMPKIDFKLICLVDDDTEKQGGNFLGYNVVCPEDIETFDVDAVIITSCIYGKEIRKKLKEADYPDKKIIDFFT